MTPKEALINIVLLKDEMVKKALGFRGSIDYITVEDLADLESWDESVCLAVLKKMGTKRGDNYLCPWCLVLDDHGYYRCDECCFQKKDNCSHL